MQPVPCNHCGYNFMRRDLTPDAPRLCNGCEVRENQRNPKGKKMDTIGILIQCPKDEHIVIEELCINQGIDLTRYFLELHYGSQAAIKTMEYNRKEHEEKGGKWKEDAYNEPIKLKIDGTSPVKNAYIKLEEKPKGKKK